MNNVHPIFKSALAAVAPRQRQQPGLKPFSVSIRFNGEDHELNTVAFTACDAITRAIDVYFDGNDAMPDDLRIEAQAIAWAGHAKTSVVIDDESCFSGKRLIAECDNEEIATLVAVAPDLLEELIEQDKFLCVLAGTVPLSEKNTHRRIAMHLESVRAAIAKATGKAA